MSTYKNNVVVKLAQAIIDIQSVDIPNIDAILDKLSGDLHHLSRSRDSVKRLAKLHTEDIPKPDLIEVTKYVDRNSEVHSVPKGYRLRFAFVTSKMWPTGFNCVHDEPLYQRVDGTSGAPYVDVWFERIDAYKSKRVTAPQDQVAAFIKMIRDDHMLKTSLYFNEGTKTPVQLHRLTIMHDEFCKLQGIELDAE